MNRRTFLGQLTGGMLLLAGCGGNNSNPVVTLPKRKRLLVLTQTVEYRHSSIATAVEAIRSLGEETKEWEIVQQADTETQVANAITEENLRTVDAVVFANTTGTLSFTPQGRTAFHQWIRDGGSYIGFHSAGDTFHNDPNYLDLLGGEFQTHGPQTEVTIFVQDTAHPACRDLPESFSFFDEIYEFQHWNRSSVHVLLSMHQHPQSGAPGDFPIAWTKRVGEGRMFYTALGHREDVYTNILFRKHLAGGILWALGLRTGDDTVGNPIR